MADQLHILLERLKGLLGARAIGPDAYLDDLLEEIATTESLDRRRLLWREVERRFVHDVELACQIAQVRDPAGTEGTILAEAMRAIGSEPTRYFTRQIDEIMKRHLGKQAVQQVLPSLYLRQFLAELPAQLVPYAEGLLNSRGDFKLLADWRGENVEDVKKRCDQAFQLLPQAIEKEYRDEEIVDRTLGVWDILKLKEKGVP
jgi:hypothetical protein